MKKSFWLPIALGLCAYLVLPMPGRSAPLSDRIQEKQHEVESAKQKEGVLTTTIQRFSTRIDGLQGEIQATQERLDRAQSSLDRQKNALLEVRNRLEGARDRLARLRSELATARRLLAARLVEIYKSDTPDALTVVLESDGFGDLLERAEFLERISDQDREITDRVTGLRDQAQEQAVQLAKLEQREQLAAERILQERDQIASAQNQLLSSRDQLASARSDKQGVLSQVRSQKQDAMEDLASLQAEQARVAGALQGSPGPIKQGSGQLIWPVNGPVTGVVRRGAAGPHARGHRHRRARGNPDSSGRLRARGADGLCRRLRQLHLRPAHGLDVHLLRPPVQLRHVERRLGLAGPGDRLQRQHRQLDRAAPALRGKDQRVARRPDGLSLAE